MVITSPADRFFPLPRLDGQINRAAGRAELDAPAEGPVKLGLPQGHRPQVALTTPTDRTARPAVVTHHARATATAANDAVDSLHGDAPLARSPSLACPIHQFAPGGGGGACLERRACIALHASCMALSPRARELPARTRTAAGGALGPGHASQQRGRPRAEQRARLALASFDAYAWHGRRGQLLLCLQQRAGGRSRAEQRAFVWIAGFSFLIRGIQRSFSDPVCSDE